MSSMRCSCSWILVHICSSATCISPSCMAVFWISLVFSSWASCVLIWSSVDASADWMSVTFMMSSICLSVRDGTCASCDASSCERRSSSSTFSTLAIELSIIWVKETTRVLLRFCLRSCSTFLTEMMSMNCALSSGLYSSRCDISRPHTRMSLARSYASVRFQRVPTSTETSSSLALSCAPRSFWRWFSLQSETCSSWISSSFSRHAVLSFRLWIFCLRAASSVTSDTSGWADIVFQ
mmetsp:Transcript_18456/g.57253  ORF Transcript_18456/g.57253 Transcript_18456/m.57253 type:complete len:237 (-) Transcript_18456:20-730(-)